MLLMGSRGSKRTDADFRSGAIREIGPARKYASHDPKFAPAMGNEMARDGTRLALFIDGANAHATAKALGFNIDYKRLLTEFQSRGTLVRAFYYTALFEDQEYSSIRPLIDWLDYNGFTVVTKPAKGFDDGEGRRKFKRSMRVELAVDALEIANQVDNIMLFSGDGDFCSVLEAVQRRGVHVTVISSLRSKPPMIADELRPTRYGRRNRRAQDKHPGSLPGGTIEGDRSDLRITQLPAPTGFKPMAVESFPASSLRTKIMGSQGFPGPGSAAALDRLAQPLHGEFDVLRLQVAPALDLRLV